MSEIVTPESVRISRLQKYPLQALSAYPYGCDKESVRAEYTKAALLSEPNAGVALKVLAAYYSQSKLTNREDVRLFSLDTMLRIAEQFPELVLRFARENRDNPDLLEPVVLNKAQSVVEKLRDAEAQLEAIYRASGVHPKGDFGVIKPTTPSTTVAGEGRALDSTAAARTAADIQQTVHGIKPLSRADREALNARAKLLEATEVVPSGILSR
jgi:hypothetical protein